MRARNSLAIICAVALTGCSYSYELRAVVINGRLAFIVDPKSARQPDCIRGIHVSTDEAVHAAASAADDKKLVANGVFWWKDFAVTECRNPFPVLYGAPLKGEPSTNGDRDNGTVDAKPLRIGVVYDVDATSSGSGYGGGRFRILPDRRVENLPLGGGSMTLGNDS